MLQRISERAGYLKREDPTPEQIAKKIQPKIIYQKKPCNPHWYRHSRTTIWAPHYTDQVLCKLMGWISGSDEPKRYVHLCGIDVKDAFKKVNSLAEVPKQIPAMITCFCGGINNSSERYCYQCHKPLTVDIAIIDKQRRDAAIEEAFHNFEKMMKNSQDQQEWTLFSKRYDAERDIKTNIYSETTKEVKQ